MSGPISRRLAAQHREHAAWLRERGDELRALEYERHAHELETLPLPDWARLAICAGCAAALAFGGHC